MDWAGIRNEYITTTISQRALAEKYGVSHVTLGKRAKREGWLDARRQKDDKTKAKTIEKASERGSNVRLSVYDTAERLLRVVNGQIDSIEGGEPINPKDVATTLKIVRDVLDVKSERDLAEQDARIEKLRREAAGEAQDREITVRFAEGEGWQN